MFDGEVVVAGHICLDVIPTFALAGEGAVQPGTLVRVGPARFAPGGAVANVGLTLHRLGCSPRLVGKLGADSFGATLLDVLRNQDAALVTGMRVIPGETTSYSIVINPAGVDRTFLHCTGANDTFVAADLATVDWSGVRLLHFGYPPLMARIAADDGVELAMLLANAHDHGVTTVLDMAWPDPSSPLGQLNWDALLRRCLPYVDCFMPSIEELRLMLDGEGHAAHWTATYLDMLAEQCLAMGVALVAIKLGDQGLYVQSTADVARLSRAGAALAQQASQWRGQHLWAPCFDATIAGTTGAGDATIGGFIIGLLAGDAPVTTLTGAVAVGACSVEATDASSGIPRWDQVQARIAAGWQRVPMHTNVSQWEWAATPGVWRGPHQNRGGML